jgi:hypothetical protein
MVAFGFVEILMVALMSGGVNSTDLVALIQPADYFKARQFEPTIDRLIDVVIAEPTTPKAQIMQLVALRQLADDADKFKKAKNYDTNRIAIEEIAEGKRGKDAQGFAQEYARRILDKLDGKKPAAVKLPPLREDVLNWCPAQTAMAFAFDIRRAQEPPNDGFKALLKLLPASAKNEMYTQLEKVGNVRIERVVFAMVDDGKPEDVKMIVRVTGKANPDWVARAMADNIGGNIQTKQKKAADGTPMLVLEEQGGGLFAFIGDTDFVIAGRKRFNGDHAPVLEEVLEVRAKKKPHAGTGVLKERLAKVSDKAVAFAVADLSEWMKADLRRAFDAAPGKMSAYVERTANGLEAKGEATMANAEDAGKFVKKVAELRKLGIAELEREMKQPMRPGTPMIPFKGMISVLEGLQVTSKGDRVEMRGFAPTSVIQEIGQAGLLMRSRDLEPVPFEDKKEK